MAIVSLIYKIDLYRREFSSTLDEITVGITKESVLKIDLHRTPHASLEVQISARHCVISQDEHRVYVLDVKAKMALYLIMNVLLPEKDTI